MRRTAATVTATAPRSPEERRNLVAGRDGRKLRDAADRRELPAQERQSRAVDAGGFTLPFGHSRSSCPFSVNQGDGVHHGTNNLASPFLQYVKQGPKPPGAANNEEYTLATGAPHNLLLERRRCPSSPPSASPCSTWRTGPSATTRGKVTGSRSGRARSSAEQTGPTLSSKALAVAVIALSCVVWMDLGAAGRESGLSSSRRSLRRGGVQ